MIRTAFQFLKNELDAFFSAREQDVLYTSGNNVVINSLVLPNGASSLNDMAHAYMMLVGVSEARSEGRRPYYQQSADNEFQKLNPPVQLELMVMFAAHNSNYSMALHDLTTIISFFQANPVFDANRYPALNASVNEPDNTPWQLIERLSVSIYNLSLEQQNNLWSMVGAKYLPSVVYKINMLTVFDTHAKEKIAPITELKVDES